MKRDNLIFAALSFAFIIAGCHWTASNNEAMEVTTPLSYKNILGTYVFKPDTFQAKRLGIKFNDTVILKITSDSLKINSTGFKSASGKYYINKMVLAINGNADKPYSGGWGFYYFKDNIRERHADYNSISFNQRITNGSHISYKIAKDNANTFHILGYTADPRYEVVKIIDFKKVK